ncbi:dehydrogenase/reductase SDR family member on chromosome X [Sinocyclocheilus grahami]|uniref:dehydrogenase/reductase SDR family member on chromosome X n=1 Tax=Sinocyclocheilus grahami TaxID=75366 RepID=UPI0007AD49BE|nr:PREDICTED: dehydrogenase/reductase SDR family member on chromosome X-like [Sinocyclocheilus grahami]
MDLGVHVIIALHNKTEGQAAVKKICEENSDAQPAVMLVPEGRTEDGLETHFATNYLGHFLLTRLLLDSLAHSGKDGSCSSVVSVSSSAHFAADARLQDLLSILRLTPADCGSSGSGRSRWRLRV